MKFGRFATIITFFLIFLQKANGQNYGLKIINVRDSLEIDSTVLKFDKCWYGLMSSYGTDSAIYFSDCNICKDRKHPLISFNFIQGVDIPFHMAFNYNLIGKQKYTDSQYAFQLDLDWMQYSVLFNMKSLKISDFSDVNYYQWESRKYKNILIYHPSYFRINEKGLKKGYSRIKFAMKDLDLSLDSFYNQQIVSFSSFSFPDVDRYIGTLAQSNYFNIYAFYGGMADPYNRIVLSGISQPFHVHELLHFAIYLKTCNFIAEGLATYYGGTGKSGYKELSQKVRNTLQTNSIQTFEAFWKFNNMDFGSMRGHYVVAALVLDKVKRDFGISKYREFVRSCTTQENMLTYLQLLYPNLNEQDLFQILIYN
ncbi:MAG: hypothetical protein KG003_08725 [Bacteroidetes bacterium]|nr:hypothetical protein [Bacteroidota bacterium]